MITPAYFKSFPLTPSCPVDLLTLSRVFRMGYHSGGLFYILEEGRTGRDHSRAKALDGVVEDNRLVLWSLSLSSTAAS